MLIVCGCSPLSPPGGGGADADKACAEAEVGDRGLSNHC